MKPRRQIILDRVSDSGRTRLVIQCPFCGERCIGYVWSLAGSGKRCACGAKHGYGYTVPPAHPQPSTGAEETDA